MSTKDQLERIADAIDGGGDYNQGKPDEVGYLTRIANKLEESGGIPSGGGGDSIYTYNGWINIGSTPPDIVLGTDNIAKFEDSFVTNGGGYLVWTLPSDIEFVGHDIMSFIFIYQSMGGVSCMARRTHYSPDSVTNIMWMSGVSGVNFDGYHIVPVTALHKAGGGEYVYPADFFGDTKYLLVSSTLQCAYNTSGDFLKGAVNQSNVHIKVL